MTNPKGSTPKVNSVLKLSEIDTEDEGDREGLVDEGEDEPEEDEVEPVEGRATPLLLPLPPLPNSEDIGDISGARKGLD